MHSKFDLPIERQVEYQELFGTSMFYVFVITFFICAILHTSFTYKEHMLVIELSKCQKIIANINNKFDIFDDDSVVRYMDINKMLSITDSMYDSSVTGSETGSGSGSESERETGSGTDSLEVSEEDTSCDEEVEKAALRLLGMSRGKNWEF
tara:strand:+ start:315 stop:767 length:453 start_codon:yes stop_codon:yes gene_type:complete